MRKTKACSRAVLEEGQLCYHWQTCQADIIKQQNLPNREQFQFVNLHIIGILIILKLSLDIIWT